MADVKILAFSGSARKESCNQKLVQVAAAEAEKAGALVTVINLRDYPLPIMDEDFEAENGHTAEVKELKRLFTDHHGLLISCPEYNSSITPLLKNTIDWISRPVEGEPPLGPYINKIAGLMAASPGALGGLRGLVHVRSILQNIGVTVVPKQLAVSRAFQAFDDQGNLSDASQVKIISDIANLVVKFAKAANA